MADKAPQGKGDAKGADKADAKPAAGAAKQATADQPEGDATTNRSTRMGAPAAAPPAAQTKPAADQATASPSGPRVGANASAMPNAPVEPANVGKPLPKPVAQKDQASSTPASAPAAATASAAEPTATSGVVPSTNAAPAAASKPAPAAPTVSPTGDHASLASAFQGTSFALLEDGVGVTTVAGDDLFQAAAWAKQNGYVLLSNLSAYDRGDHFGVLYCLVKLAATPAEFGELRLRVTMPKQVAGATVEPACPSLEDVYPAAAWHEREMYDMYGIRFEGNSDLRRMFLPEGWTGHPMRKDYKEPEQFVALREGEDHVVRTNEEGSW